MAATDDWTKQRVTIDTGYGGERMDVILFVPKRGTPPFQPVMFVSGIQIVLFPATIESIDAGIRGDAARLRREVRADAGPADLSGYVQPVEGAATIQADEVRTTREWIERRWDLGRTIDYLETRPDVDASRLGFIGVSFGASSALPLVAVETALESCGVPLGRTAVARLSPVYLSYFLSPLYNRATDHASNSDNAAV